MSFIKFDVCSYRWNTTEADPNDPWDRASTDATVSVNGAIISEKDKYDCLPVDFEVKSGDTIWLLWAIYSTGDSFGHDGGQYELLEVHQTQEQAEVRRVYYENVKGYSVPWNGYFEHLDEIRVEAFKL